MMVLPLGLDGWWQTLSIAGQIFYAIGILSLFALIIQIFLVFFGIGGGDMPDAGGHSHDIGVLSIKSVTGFFFGFGWGGAITMNAGGGVPLAVVVGTLSGGALLLTTFGLMKALSSIHSDGTVKLKNATGQTGTVYLTIPPKGEGAGQIQVIVQGQMITVQALNNGADEIKNTEKVRVVSSLDESTVIVEKIS